MTPEARADLLRHACDWTFVVARPKRLGVAVSGGSDSMALLDLMVWHGAQKGLPIEAVTVDHGLRPEAKDEAAMVARFCAGRKIPHETVRWDGWDGQGNLQARARKARYALVIDWAKRRGVDMVALGHTQDDQAETVLMRLARRSGVDGLAGMRGRFEREGLVLVRPLLRLSREDLRNYLRDQGIAWCDDPSNEDDSYERVRARKAAGVLTGLGIDAEVLSEVALNARSAKVALDHYVVQEAGSAAVTEDRGDLFLPERAPTPDFPMPGEILRRLTIAGLQWISGAEYSPRSHALVAMEAGLSAADRHTLSGCLVTRIRGNRRGADRLRFSRELNALKDLRCPTDRLWDGRWKLDGPHEADLEIRVLGETLYGIEDWREQGLPRASLLASPAVWRGPNLVAAPLAGFGNGWTASATGRGTFTQFLQSR